MSTQQGGVDTIYRTRDVIVDEMTADLLSRVPDAYTGSDSLFSIVCLIVAAAIEGDYLAVQLLFNDIWPQTQDSVALLRTAEQFGFPPDLGTVSEGQVTFTGQGGVLIPAGSLVAAVVLGAEVTRFKTTADSTLPNPGIPDIPTAAENVASGNVTGTIEYGLTYVSLSGETEIGPYSAAVFPVAKKVDLSDISLGGPGTIGRKIYRRENGGDPKFVALINNNTDTIYQDNVATGSLGGGPPVASTAERVTAPAESVEVGLKTNVAAGTITSLTDVPDGVLSVNNAAPFIGGAEPENIEEFRQELIEFIQDPQSGSARDLKAWAEEVDGVDEASVFVNMDGTTPKNGHNTIRISGPTGTIPDADVIVAVEQKLLDEDLANITNHVITFTPVTVNVTVDVTPATGYDLPSVTPEVEEAVSNYVNSVAVGQTVYKAGIVDAVFGLLGIDDVVVTTPATNTTTTSTQKAVIGTVTVT